MVRGRTKNFSRQMWAVQSLEISPREDATVIRFEVNDCHNCVLVRREYKPNHVKNISYSEIFKVGPLGAIKKINEYMNY